MWLAFAAFFAAFLLTSSLGALIFFRGTALRRLSRIVAQPVDAAVLSSIAPPPNRKIEKLMKPFEKVVPRSKEDVSSLQKRLTRAGYRDKSCVSIFYASKVLVPGLFLILAVVTQAYRYNVFFVLALAGGIGFLTPDYWLANRMGARQELLRLGLPEALDLIVICTEAGLSIDGATMRTAEELRVSQPAIADELNLVYLEQRAGRPRSEAWRSFGERTGVDTIRSVASILIQADKFGTSIGKTLRNHADMLRIRRRQEAEERAATTSVKLVFPLILFIFPSLFVVTLGPSMIILLEGFAKYLD